jgi:hypothetical protein
VSYPYFQWSNEKENNPPGFDDLSPVHLMAPLGENSPIPSLGQNGLQNGVSMMNKLGGASF